MMVSTGALPPIRARLLVVAGALTLSPDTLLMRLARFKTKNALGKSVGLAFYRGLGRLCLTPPMWLLTQPRGSSFVAACRSLGPRRTLLGAGLYVTQNVAFIVATQLTYVASVLAAVATGPLFAAAFSSVVTGERVPSHTWAAAAACVGCVGLIYADALLEQDSPKHLQGNLVAMLVPSALGLYWVLCRATPGQDMVPALSLSGLGGIFGAVAAAVITAHRGDGSGDGSGGSWSAPLEPAPGDVGALAALVAQVALVALAFTLLTVGARDVPSAEVSLYMLLELPIAPLFVWAATGENPGWRVFIAAAGIMAAMTAEARAGLRDAAEDLPHPSDETRGETEEAPSVGVASIGPRAIEVSI